MIGGGIATALEGWKKRPEQMTISLFLVLSATYFLSSYPKSLLWIEGIGIFSLANYFFLIVMREEEEEYSISKGKVFIGEYRK